MFSDLLHTAISNNNNKSIFKVQNLIPRDYSKHARTHTHTHTQATLLLSLLFPNLLILPVSPPIAPGLWLKTKNTALKNNN